MTPEQEKDIRSAIGDLEQKLNTVFTAGLAAMNLTIVQLTEAHHKALIDQEKRNSNFADRDRVDDIARRLDRCEGQADRVGRLEQAIDRLASSITALEQKTHAQSLKFLGGAAGYLMLLLINLCSVTATYILAHGGH